MVGHSMGGILERLYVQEIDNLHTNKLITLNTPHFGSPLGNVFSPLIDCLDCLPQNVKNKIRIFVDTTGSRQAISDLAIGSDAIRNLNSNSHRLHNVPIFAIGTYIDSNPPVDVKTYPSYITDESAFLLAHLFYNIVPRDKYNFLFADDVLGDGVVSIESQLGGLPSKYYSLLSGKPGVPFTPIGGALHICSPNWKFALEEIRLLLLSDPDSNIFSMNGFGSLTRSLSQSFSSRSSSDYVTEFVEPNPESYIKLSANLDSENDSIYHTSIECGSDMITTMVFSFLSPDKMIASYDKHESSLNLLEPRDSITFYAIGRTDYNALLVDSITIKRVEDSGVRDILTSDYTKFNHTLNGNNLKITGLKSDYSLTIFNLAGIRIASYKKNEDDCYNIAPLCEGVYLVRITTPYKSYTFKFSK